MDRWKDYSLKYGQGYGDQQRMSRHPETSNRYVIASLGLKECVEGGKSWYPKGGGECLIGTIAVEECCSRQKCSLKWGASGKETLISLSPLLPYGLFLESPLAKPSWKPVGKGDQLMQSMGFSFPWNQNRADKSRELICKKRITSTVGGWFEGIIRSRDSKWNLVNVVLMVSEVIPLYTHTYKYSSLFDMLLVLLRNTCQVYRYFSGLSVCSQSKWWPSERWEESSLSLEGSNSL